MATNKTAMRSYTKRTQSRISALQPMGCIAETAGFVDAVLSLTRAGQVTGEVVQVDGVAHDGRRWR